MHHTLIYARLLGLATVLAVVQASVHAEEPATSPTTFSTAEIPSPAAADASEWAVTVSPYLWMPSLRGNGALAGQSGRFKAPLRKTVRDLDFVAMGNVTVTHGRYGAFGDGQYLDLSKHLTFSALPGGGDTSVRATQLSLGGFYVAYQRVLGGSTLFGAPRQWTLAPTAGVHWTRLRARAWADGLTANHINTWAVPFIGLRSGYDLNERLSLSTQWDIGAWGRQYNLQGQAYLGYRLGILGKEAMLRVGGRLLHQDYQSGDFHWNVSQYGPVVGVSMTF
ncbi:TPA: hypothetical protein SMI12_002163 [Serratia liquefaciens]|nr:hypothetical protein [Serratia liquefaciens]